MQINLVRLKNKTIFEQLQLEEALLRADDQNWCLIQDGAAPSIVMGISGDAEEHLNLNLLQQAPVPVIKRFSGGGTVFVDHNTCFVSFICQAKDMAPPTPDAVFCWSEKFYREVFEGHPFALKERDYVFHDRKFGGNAQYMRKERWLHHTTFLWNFDAKNMEYLQMPSRRPAYRQDRPHTEFLTKLIDHFSSRDVFWNQLTCALEKRYTIVEVSEENARDALERPHRKSTKENAAGRELQSLNQHRL